LFLMTIPEYSFHLPREVERLIKKYFTEGTTAYHYYFTHCVMVTKLALKIARSRNDLDINTDAIIAAGMLHDIGIIKTDAPEIGCYGEYPYIAHTYLGREILEENGFADIAPVCERHVGTGLSREDIIKYDFPLPHRDMLPVTLEEKLICYADKFYSKSEKHLTSQRTPDEIRKKILKYGDDKLARFNELSDLFGTDL
jgi:uncharacterized protein